jgi:hypothetical protein
MAWYPGATKYELQPESDAQAAIRPTQFIVHSIIAPWTAKRVYEYWRDSTNLESHFGLGYEGDLGQFIGTETRADANADANRRADGTGAVSIETASNLQGSDPWTAAQVEKLIKLGAWLHKTHGIPLRICRSHDDPGFGYHRLFPQWSTSGTSCPGDARVKQFKEVVFPGIVARATGSTPPEEDGMALTADDVKKLWTTDNVIGVPADWSPGNDYWTAASLLVDQGKRLRSLQTDLKALTAVNGELVKTVATLAANIGDLDPAAIVAELKGAIESVTIHLDANGV